MISCMNPAVFYPGEYRGCLFFCGRASVRIDFFGDEVESIRYFDVETQLSEQLIDKVVIVPDLSSLRIKMITWG